MSGRGQQGRPGQPPPARRRGAPRLWRRLHLGWRQRNRPGGSHRGTAAVLRWLLPARMRQALARWQARWRRTGNRLHARRLGLHRPSTALLAPPEPRGLGLEARGRQIASGELWLAGHLLQLRAGESPFGRAGQPPAFTAALHAFPWLDDLATLPGAAPRRIAQNWLFDWLHRYRRGAGPGWEPGLTGPRLRRWLHHAPFLLAGRGAADQALFLRVLARQVLFLARRWPAAQPGLPRIEALAGLLMGGLSLQGMEAHAQAAAAGLGAEAARAIDGEGGIPGRNPEELAEIFALLAATGDALARAGIAVTPGHRAALERAAPVLRALRHGDGSLARFHGGGRGAEGRLERALAASGVRSPALAGRLALGFLRVTHGRSSLILDAAPPPQGPGSARAHASTLAFELTSGRRPLIVSCGPGAAFGPEWQRAGRVTAGHSTLEILGLSSARIERMASGAELLVEGPRQVRLQRTDDAEGTGIAAAHDGYVRSHGLTHIRRLEFHAGGRVLSGEDTLAAETAAQRRRFEAARAESGAGAGGGAGAEGGGLPIALRFHLHPEVEARREGAAIRLTLRSGEEWLFRHDGAARLGLAESVWLEPDMLRPVATLQIVLSGLAMDHASRIRWSLAKAEDVPLAIRDLAPGMRPDAAREWEA